MSDQISRADAIKAVEQEYRIDRGYMVDDYTYGFNQAIHYVSDIILPDLPSAETHEIRTETHACVKETHDTDLISRADAIEAVLELNTDGRVSWKDAVIDILYALPSAEAGWIPCSERLPEKDDLVLVTVWNDVTIAWRNIYGGWESAEDMYEKGDVIAWMPLPSPYREDGEV